jgi:hypothetical protein
VDRLPLPERPVVERLEGVSGPGERGVDGHHHGAEAHEEEEADGADDGGIHQPSADRSTE